MISLNLAGMLTKLLTSKNNVLRFVVSAGDPQKYKNNLTFFTIIGLHKSALQFNVTRPYNLFKLFSTTKACKHTINILNGNYYNNIQLPFVS